MNKKRDFELPKVPLIYSIPLLVVFISAFFILLLLFRIEPLELFLEPLPLNVVNVSSCGTLTQSDTYYVLNQSIDFLGPFCIVISGNNVIFDGKSMYLITQSSGSGDAVYVNGDNVTITGVNITSLGSGRIVHGIYSTGREISIFNNYIHNATAGGIGLENNSGGIVNKNSIYNSYLGINIRGFSNSFVTQNLIVGYNSSLRTSFGIILEPTPDGVFTSNNSVSNNVIKETSYGIKLEGGSVDSNLLSDNIIISPFLSGVSSYVGYSNVLRNISIFNPRRNGIEVIVPSYLPNPLTIISDKIKVINGNQSHYDLYVNNPSFHNSSIVIIDNSFANYMFNNTYLTFNDSFARIMFNQILNVSGNNLSSDIKTRFNYVSVDSVLRRGLNKSAIISFFGLPTNITNAAIYRDGVQCPLTICINLTSLNAGNVMFRVNGWSNYSINLGNYSSPSITTSVVTINKPSNNGLYTLSSFPLVFDVSLNRNGNVLFGLNNDSVNITMNTTNNVNFSYIQNSLSLGNYIFRVYANFVNGDRLNASVNFSVVDNLPTMIINEPDNNEVYYLNEFPITFKVVLNLNGTVKFSLNNGTTNITMNTTNNVDFSYIQNSLSLGNYMFTAYANLLNGTKISDFVKFSVVNTTGSGGGSGGGGGGSGNSNGSSGGGNNLNNSSNQFNLSNYGSNGGTQVIESKQSTLSGWKGAIYWLVVGVIFLMAIVLVLLIVKALREKMDNKLQFNYSNEQLVSNLK